MDKINFIETERGKFSYREKSVPGAPNMFMVHGWPESSYSWVPVSEGIDCNIIAPDLRGLGDSNRDGEMKAYTKVELAKDMLKMMDALGIETIDVLCGHDWGGAVVQHMYFLAPERFKKLILINMVIINNLSGAEAASKNIAETRGKFVWYQHFQRMPNLPEAMIPGNERVWLSPFLRSADGSPFNASNSEMTHLDKAFEEYVRMYSIPKTAGTGANYYRAMDLDVMNWVELAEKKFELPTLYLYGELDPVITDGYLDKVEEKFANSFDIVKFPNGHFVHEENPKAVAVEISKFAKS